LWSVLRVIMEVLKQTAARIIVLVIMLGYSTAKVSLSRPTIIFMLGTCLGYGVSCLAYSMVKIAPSLRTLTPLTTEIVQFPGVMFNLVCYGWFFVAAYNTMQYLREHRQMWKVEIYHSFSIILGISLFLSILATIAKGAAIILQWDDIWWQVWWMWDSFWYTLFFVTLILGLWLWRPLPDNTVYHLTQEMRNLQTQEDLQSDSESEREHNPLADENPNDVDPPLPSTVPGGHSDDLSDSEKEDQEVKLEMKNREGRDTDMEDSDPEERFFYKRRVAEETEYLVI